ncbi:MAG: hypothetical protein JWM21_4060 [Acidobacteria bacterium]|nr:hypothetical protein [Acidobacteriota bacterium]
MARRMIIMCAILAMPFCTVNAQNAAKNWLFGRGARVDFNTTVPTTTAVTTTINTIEGSSAISDSSGNLLFYTDGITVWDKSNNQMPNGFGLKGSPSSTHSALIVPCSCNKYFIFTTSAAEPTNNYSDGLQYSVVDMSANSNLGDVITKNVQLLAKASEKVAGVSDGAGGFWLVGHKMLTNQFFSYHIAAGDDCKLNAQSAIISSVGAVFSGGTADFGQGQMKFSPDGTMIADAGLNYQTSPASFVELFQFNKSTGVVSNLGISTARDTSTEGFYGVEFSPDSKHLYATTMVTNNFIYRYDNVATNKLSAISRTTIHSFGNSQYSVAALQLAPDGKIYVARKNFASLYVLSAPNTANGGWSTIPFNLAPGSLSMLGLPTVVAGEFSCGPTPDVCCDKMRVSPYPNPPLNQDYRTFEIFNFKQPTSAICSIDVDMQPAPPTTFWQGGQAFQNLNGTSGGPLSAVNFVYASLPPAYRRIPTLSPNMMSALSNPITSPAVKFNLGFDNTQAYNGVTNLTINHCDGTKCVLQYAPWIVNPATPGGGSLPWSIDIRELSAELSEITLTYQAGGRQNSSPQSAGARWLGLRLLSDSAEVYSIDGPGAGDEQGKKLRLSSSSKAADAALFEFSGLLSLKNLEQNGKTITLLLKRKGGERIDPKQLRLTLYDENANPIMTGSAR